MAWNTYLNFPLQLILDIFQHTCKEEQNKDGFKETVLWWFQFSILYIQLQNLSSIITENVYLSPAGL